MNNTETKIKVFCAYIFTFLGGIVIYLTEKEDRFVKFHSMQSILLGLCVCAIGLIAFILGWIPIIGAILRIIRFFAGIVFLAATILCIVKAMDGEEFHLPIIGYKAASLSK